MEEHTNVEKLLVKHGIRPSRQRMEIMRYLLTYRNHPNVETIHSYLVKDMPSLSKTTVYNTLHLFIEKGVAILLNIEENETRYDADTSIHGHFKCRVCGEIFDFPIDKELFQLRVMEQFKIDECQLYLKGVCKSCSKAK